MVVYQCENNVKTLKKIMIEKNLILVQHYCEKLFKKQIQKSSECIKKLFL